MNTRPQTTVSVSLAAMILVGAFLASGCGSKNDHKVNAAAVPPPAVIVEAVDQKTVPIYSEFVGQTKALETVQLRARVEGVLQKVHFAEGSAVRKGQLLFTIDKRPFEAALQSANAALAKATSDLAQARQRTDVLQAQAQLADAIAVYSKAVSDLNRMKPLAKEKAVTELELDAAVAAEKSAKATGDAPQDNLTNLSHAENPTIGARQTRIGGHKGSGHASHIRSELLQYLLTNRRHHRFSRG